MAYNKEEHLKYVDWAEAKVNEWAVKMKPYYTPNGFDNLKYRITEMVGAGSKNVGVVDFVFGGRVSTTTLKNIFNKDYEEAKTAVERLLENIYKMVKGLHEKDYDTARAAYNEDIAFFTEENINNIQGPDFLVQHIIPGSKVTGYVNIIQKNLEYELNKKAPEWKNSKEAKEYLREQALKVYANVSTADHRNIERVNIELNGEKILNECLKMVEKEATNTIKPAERGEN